MYFLSKVRWNVWFKCLYLYNVLCLIRSPDSPSFCSIPTFITNFWKFHTPTLFKGPRARIFLLFPLLLFRTAQLFNANPIKWPNTLNSRRIAWVCLTILWGWHLKFNVFCRSTISQKQFTIILIITFSGYIDRKTLAPIFLSYHFPITKKCYNGD